MKNKKTITCHDHRYVQSTDDRAVLRAWAGYEANMDMGGWTDGNEGDFRKAVLDLLASQMAEGEEIEDEIVIEPMAKEEG